MRLPRTLVALPLAFLLSACMDVVTGATPVDEVAPQKLSVKTAVNNFVTVMRRVEPVAERECRQRRPGANCDLLIAVDDDPKKAPNAYQTLNRNGRPVVVFTVSLIAEARNQDEIAFILGHEAAHHIRGHIPKTQETALAGATLAGVLAALGGAGQAGVDAAQNVGATLATRQYSKGFELEADQLGTIIAMRAGYDPVRGSRYFARIPDPGNRFLASHPANAARIKIVRETAAAQR